MRFGDTISAILRSVGKEVSSFNRRVGAFVVRTRLILHRPSGMGLAELKPERGPMRNRGWVTLVGLLQLVGGCNVINEGRDIVQGSDRSAALVSKVRGRLPSLRPGMTHAEVMKILSDLPLGEEAVVSMTISGGETVQYALSAKHRLELTFIPSASSPTPPGGLTEARLLE
jgi:hypothetical protein